MKHIKMFLLVIIKIVLFSKKIYQRIKSKEKKKLANDFFANVRKPCFVAHRLKMNANASHFFESLQIRCRKVWISMDRSSVLAREFVQPFLFPGRKSGVAYFIDLVKQEVKLFLF